MGKFDNYNLSINDRLPEYWKQDIFLTPIERFSALLIRDTVQRFMEKLGVLQPFMVWKTLPEEYNWEYGFEDYDLRLANNEENQNCNQTLTLGSENHIVAQLPLTKRNTHAYIVIELSSLSFSDSTEFTQIKELVIKNANQILKIKDINSKTVIEINTKDQSILLNDMEPKAGQIEGSIEILKRSPREDPAIIDDALDINEVCELEIYLPNGESASCDLYVELLNPVYVTEQNIRIHSLSAFPIEYVRLYGYMCHQYNNKHQWVYLWEKTYAYQDRIVYDRITKQYDCEIFYIEVKLYGLPAPIYVGFPATLEESVEGIFSLNSNLDYWGEIFNIPRRFYKTDIPEEQERYCYPKYYNYSVEQDYPYEQRIINEYKYNEDWQDYINIVDTDGTDLALVKCKDPYIENIYMYTETILPTDILNSRTTMYPNCVKELDNNNTFLQQATWENPQNIRYDSNSYTIAHLNRQDEENITNKSYQSNILSFEYDLSSLPENCKIRGMELKFKGVSNTHSDNIFIDERSFLKYTKKVLNDESGNHTWQSQEVPLSSYFSVWSPDNSSYVLGDSETIFGLDEIIDRDSIEKGYLRNGLYQDNKIRFDIGFTNISNILDLVIKLFSVQLTVYFDLIKEEIDLSVNIPNKTIIYDNSNNQSSAIDINLEFKNEGEIKEINYNSFIILPKELCFVDGVHMGEAANNIKELRLGKLNEDENVNVLHIDETWKYSTQVIANNDPNFKSGRYDIIVICGDKIYTEEVFIYDKDYAIYNNYISYNADDTSIELSFVENYVEAEFGNANVTVKLTKNNAPYPYQYIYLKDINGNMNYRILDENGEASFVYTVQDDTQIKAYYSNLNAICHIKYVLGECLELVYDTSINPTVRISRTLFKQGQSFNIDWGDGERGIYEQNNYTHTYDEQKTYLVRIWGDDFDEIRDGAFYSNAIGNNQENLISVKAENIIQIGDGAFDNCSSLTEVNLPNVTTIGQAAFMNCSSLTEVNLPNVTTTGLAVFNDCSSLTEISLPNITTIKQATFYKCSSLVKIDLPNVITIESSAFEYCSSLTEINMQNVETILSGAFSQCSALTEIDLPNLIPIQKGAFNQGSALEKINLQKITNIDATPFWGCSNLTTAILPQLRILKSGIFTGFSKLTNIYLENVEEIQQAALQGTGIQEITLPETLTTLSSTAFLQYSNSSQNFFKITFKSSTPPSIKELRKLALNSYSRGTRIHVPCGAKETYANNPYYPDIVSGQDIYVEDCD